jgi:hypothetical protein
VPGLQYSPVIFRHLITHILQFAVPKLWVDGQSKRFGGRLLTRREVPLAIPEIPEAFLLM